MRDGGISGSRGWSGDGDIGVGVGVKNRAEKVEKELWEMIFLFFGTEVIFFQNI